MKRSLLVLTLLAFSAGGVEATGLVGTGTSSAGDSATASITQKSDGSHVLVLSVAGSACTAVYDNPKAGGTKLSAIKRSGGKVGPRR